MSYKRKLIEVSLPLEVINRESAREKSIRHGHPSTLHLWWARRPLAAARAVLFAQLVDDPSSHPDRFPTVEDQKQERARLHGIIERLVKWENIRDDKLLAEAHQEILRSTDGRPPAILDPFAGGGTIPLEAQRLGLESHASDLNPVAVLINKALIEIPPKYRNQPPAFPGLADGEIRDWRGAEGLAADVRAYGSWMSDQALRRIGDRYPTANGNPVIAWLWSRTVECPNPACGIEMPLVRSWWLSKKKGKLAWIEPSVRLDGSGPAVCFKVRTGTAGAPATEGTVGRTGAVCVACATAVPLSYVRDQGRARKMGSTMLAVVAEASRQRVFLEANDAHVAASEVHVPAKIVHGSLGFYPRDLKAVTYGLTEFADLFTPRQLLALDTFSDLVGTARDRVITDGGSSDYADAVATYLGLGVSRLADIANALCGWENTKTQVRHLFTRQAIPMMWDFAEAPPFGQAAGSFEVSLGSLCKAIVDSGGPAAHVEQADAASRSYSGVVINTDPPYYDNIGYSDLSDFFYVWLRRTLKSVYPELLSTLQVPKAEELVANPYRHGGKVEAQGFFEEGFRSVFARARESASIDFPIVVWYAYKQSENDDSGEASTGWETLLEGMIDAGWEITSTWPNRSEMSNRMMAKDMNALASSIVLSLRPRKLDAPSVDRRGYLDELREELPQNLRELQQGAIAPVDLAQAAIGPGMAVFSRHSKVVEPNGTNVTVREALRLINTVLAEVLSDQEGDFDTDTRWCLKWYETHGFEKAAYGEAETLATAFGTSVKGLDQSGAVSAKGGQVKLLTTAELADNYRPERDDRISLWEVALHLVKALDEKGLDEAGRILHGASRRVEPEMVKELAYLVFSLAEKRSATQVAGMYNALVTSWPEVTAAARSHANWSQAGSAQGMLDLEDQD